MRPKRLLLLLCAVTFITLASCQPPPSISRFEVIPEYVCTVPTEVTLEWSIEGGYNRATITSDYGEGADVPPTGEQDGWNVPETPTLFTLRVEYERTRGEIQNTSNMKVVDRMTDTRISLGGEAECTPDGTYVITQNTTDHTRYPADAIIKEISNLNDFEVKVIKVPSDEGVILGAREVSSDELDGEKLYGTWYIILAPASRCRYENRVAARDRIIIDVEAVVGCP